MKNPLYIYTLSLFTIFILIGMVCRCSNSPGNGGSSSSTGIGSAYQTNVVIHTNDYTLTNVSAFGLTNGAAITNYVVSNLTTYYSNIVITNFLVNSSLIKASTNLDFLTNSLGAYFQGIWDQVNWDAGYWQP
jgi:hypothetical protein